MQTVPIFIHTPYANPNPFTKTFPVTGPHRVPRRGQPRTWGNVGKGIRRRTCLSQGGGYAYVGQRVLREVKKSAD